VFWGTLTKEKKGNTCWPGPPKERRFEKNGTQEVLLKYETKKQQCKIEKKMRETFWGKNEGGK